MFGRSIKREALGSAALVAVVATTDIARARAFYRDALGLRILGDDTHALVFDAGGTRLRIPLVAGFTPAAHTVLVWGVPDIMKIVLELKQRSVVFERMPNIEQDEHGIWIAPGGAVKVAWFRDPDGNVLSVTQTFAAAAYTNRIG